MAIRLGVFFLLNDEEKLETTLLLSVMFLYCYIMDACHYFVSRMYSDAGYQVAGTQMDHYRTFFMTHHTKRIGAINQLVDMELYSIVMQSLHHNLL